MHEFKKDAEALLAPFKNRIPAGVKGLDAVLTEYVAFKEADERRRAAEARFIAREDDSSGSESAEEVRFNSILIRF